MMMKKNNTKSNKNPLELYIDNNYPVEDMVSIEMFSFEELSAFEVEKIFINTYMPLNGAATNKQLQLSPFERCEMSSIGLITPLFLAAQLNNSYSERRNPIMGTSNEPIADLNLFNEFYKNSHETKLEDASCLEEAHAQLFRDISMNTHIHCYCDPLSDYRQNTLSILDSNVIYKKFSLGSYGLHEILGDLMGFDKIKVPKVGVFVDMIESKKSVFILKIHDMVHFIERKDSEDRFKELQETLDDVRSKSALNDEKSGLDPIISNNAISLYKEILKSDLASEAINRLKNFNVVLKYV